MGQKLAITKIEDVTHDVRQFTFEKPEGFKFTPGQAVFITDSHFVRDAANARIRSAFEGLAAGNRQVMSSVGLGGVPTASAVWGHAYGNWGRFGGNGNAAAMSYSTGGFLFGADAEFGGGWRGGLMAGYGNAGFQVDARASSGNADSYTLGAYAGRQFGPLGLHLGASYALLDVSTSRTVTAGTLRNTLSTDHAASTAQLFGEAGYSFDTGGARFEPFASFALIHQRNPAFTETGGAAALSVAAASQTLGITTIGLRAERQVADGESYTASLGGSLGWTHIIGNPGPASTMRFAGGNAFRISGVPLDCDVAQLETGLNFNFKNGGSFDLKYNGALGARTQSHTVAARFSKTF